MPGQSWTQPLYEMLEAGPTLVAASGASMLSTNGNPVIPTGWATGAMNGTTPQKVLQIVAFGQVSLAATPGTMRFDLRFSGIVVWDSLAITLNAGGPFTNIMWRLVIDLYVRAVGKTTAANMIGGGTLTSQAVVGGGSVAGVGAVATLPFAVAPAVGGGFDSTIANPVDMFFTQTVATGSFTCQGVLMTDH